MGYYYRGREGIQPTQTKGKIMKHTLTTREAAMLDAALNYETREDQHEDNYSNLCLSDSYDICGGKHEAAGVVGSLTTKGLVYIEDEDRDDDPTIWLTDEGVDAIFDYIFRNAAMQGKGLTA